MKSLYAVLSILELVLTCNDTQVFSCASKRLSHFHMLNSLCTIPVGLVVEVSPSWHQAVKPEPGSPAPELWVKPGCQADAHSFHLQTNFKRPGASSHLAGILCNEFCARPRGGHWLAEDCSIAIACHLIIIITLMKMRFVNCRRIAAFKQFATCS